MRLNKYRLFLVSVLGSLLFLQAGCSKEIEDELRIPTNPDRYTQSYPVPGSRVAGIARRADVPGAQIVHFKGEDINSYVHGYTNTETRTPVTEDHLFQAASLSKAVATYVFLKLYDKGVFDLDKPLSEYYEYDRVAKANNPKNDLVTARHVLEHTTGYPNWVTTVHSTAWWDSALQPGAAYTPGIDYRYSGEGFTYLQVVLEHLTGKTLQQMATEEVFEPFGMSNSSYEWRADFVGRGTTGHRDDYSPYNMDMMNFSQNRANSAYTLLTTARDFAKFLANGLVRGEGLKPETYALLTTTAIYPSGEDSPVTRGLGLVIQENEKGLSLYHSGSNTGYRAYCIAYPELDEGLIVLTNGVKGATFGREVFPVFLGDGQTFHIFE